MIVTYLILSGNNLLKRFIIYSSSISFIVEIGGQFNLEIGSYYHKSRLNYLTKVSKDTKNNNIRDIIILSYGISK